MSCPNCDNKNYEIGQPCADCNFYEKPEYWDLGFCPIFIEPKNWAVCFNGHVVEKELASFRDATDLVSVWDNEMNSWQRGEKDVWRN